MVAVATEGAVPNVAGQLADQLPSAAVVVVAGCTCVGRVASGRVMHGAPTPAEPENVSGSGAAQEAGEAAAIADGSALGWTAVWANANACCALSAKSAGGGKETV